jgi:3-methyladenine DNA glycosylase/8-oxoguanine DNA glycosylase
VLERVIEVDGPVDLRLTIGPLRRGARDPSLRIGPDGVWRATRTPDGPATTHLTRDGTAVRVRAWGPGAEWAVDAAPDLVGAHDDDRDFVAHHPITADLRRRLRGLRMTRSRAVVEALVPTIIEQKVVGLEAKRSYAQLVRTLGEPAPGAGDGAGPAAGLVVPPAPSTLAATPSWQFHRFGIERKRADTVRLVGAHARRLEETVTMTPEDARRRLQVLPGIGPWTAAEVSLLALGDPDAVSVGDYHLPNQVAWALAGEARADDERMLELLEPYRGHRGRVQRLIEAGGPPPPRFGPRLPLRQIAAQ